GVAVEVLRPLLALAADQAGGAAVAVERAEVGVDGHHPAAAAQGPAAAEAVQRPEQAGGRVRQGGALGGGGLAGGLVAEAEAAAATSSAGPCPAAAPPAPAPGGCRPGRPVSCRA